MKLKRLDTLCWRVNFKQRMSYKMLSDLQDRVGFDFWMRTNSDLIFKLGYVQIKWDVPNET